MRVTEFIAEGYKEVAQKYINSGVPAEDVQRAIAAFKELVNKNQVSGTERNIDWWGKKSFSEFTQFVNSIDPSRTKRQLKRGKIPGKSITLVDNDTWLVIVPLDKDASCFYGKNTDWCTAKRAPGHFEQHFYQDESILIYCINKQSGAKWAIASHTETSPMTSDNTMRGSEYDGDTQYFDAEDDEISHSSFAAETKLSSEKLLNLALQKKDKIELARVPHSSTVTRVKDWLYGPRSYVDRDLSIEKDLLFINNTKYTYDYISELVSNNVDVSKIPDRLLVDAAVYSPSVLRYMNPQPNEKVLRDIVIEVPDAIRVIKNPSLEVQKIAVTEYPAAILLIKNPNPNTVKLAITLDPKLEKALVKDNSTSELDEDWKSAAKGMGVAAGLALGMHGMPNKTVEPVTPHMPVSQQVQLPKVDPAVVKQTLSGLTNPYGVALRRAAQAAGITGTELAQFLAQCAHETQNFSSLKEFGGKLDFKKYDPKYNPEKAKLLGNTHPGDGARYHGRGFIQLTGRENYRKVGKALGLPLEQQPELVERPNVAARVAVWFWQNRVAPKVTNFNNTQAATKPINAGLNGLEDRVNKFNAIMQVIANNHRSTPSPVNEYKVDNDINGEGLGATGYNANVAYRGMRVLMRPSTFLSLALPLDKPVSVEHIKQHMQAGGALGSPFLIFDFPVEWEDGDFSESARIVGHEGRNRMLAIQDLEGDDPVEVHMFGLGELRARHLTPEIVKHLQTGMLNQNKSKLITPIKGDVLFKRI
jgi:predicted chitinase